MSDYRNQGGYGRDRFRDDDDRSGRMDERTARRNAGYGYGSGSDDDRFRSESYSSGRNDDWRSSERDEARRDSYGSGRDAYGSGRDAYGSGGRDDGRYGRGGSSSGDYLSSATRGYGRSSYGGLDFDRSDRFSTSSFGGREDRGSSFGGRDQGYGQDYGAPRGGDRYRSSFGTGSDYRDERNYGRGADSNRPGERSFFEKAGDEISSWFGDDEAERRREADRRHSGKGPKNYTRSDDRIRDDVNDRLTDDNYLDASDIEVSVKDREVTLNGHVPTREEKRRAEDVAERVSGVSHVQNNLRVRQGQGAGQWTAGGAQTGFGQSTSGTTGGFGSSSTTTGTASDPTSTTGTAGGLSGRTTTS